MELNNMTNERAELNCAFYRFLAQNSSVSIRIKQYTSKHSMVLCNHDFPQLFLCMEGAYTHIVKEQEFECSKGSAVIVPPGVFHRFWIPAGEQVQLMCLSLMYDVFLDTNRKIYINTIGNLFLPPFENAFGYTVPVHRMLSEQSLQMALECLTQAASINGYGQEVDTDLKLRFIDRVFSLPEFALPGAYRKRVDRLLYTHLRPVIKAVQYLNTHYPEKCVEDDLVRESSLGHTELYRRFRSFTGYTCSIYLQWLRTKRVHAYLVHTEHTIAYISDICGFSSQAYMTLVYKRHMGITPRADRIRKKEWLKNHPERKLRITGL